MRKLFEILTDLKGQEVPKDLNIAYISSTHKKGDTQDGNNYRDIPVTSILSRLYGRILRDLVEKEYQNHEEEEEQSRFRAGRSCTDNIFCIKQILEKR